MSEDSPEPWAAGSDLALEAARALRSLFLQAGFEHQFLPFDGVHSIPEEVLRASAELILSLAESKKAIAL